MRDHSLRIATILCHYDNGVALAEALLVPEIAYLGHPNSKLLKKTVESAKKVLENVPPLMRYQRLIPECPTCHTIRLVLEPPTRQTTWRNPISLAFEVVKWRHGNDVELVYVPELGIEVVCDSKTPWERAVASDILATLKRQKIAGSIQQLTAMPRIERITIELHPVVLKYPSPKEMAMEEIQRDATKKPVLSEIGSSLSSHDSRGVYEYDAHINRVAELLRSKERKSILLIGPSGVGKTELVHHLAATAYKHGLMRSTFWRISGAQIVAGMSGFGMWQKRCQQLWEEAAATNAILYFGNLVELMHVGKSIHNMEGIASFLRPYIARGDVRTLAECTPEQLPHIERENPQLVRAFTQVQIPEPTPDQTRAILLDVAMEFAQPSHHLVTRGTKHPRNLPSECPIDLAGIETIDRLHRRYAPYSPNPGRPVRFLRNLLSDRKSKTPLTVSQVYQTFSLETGLPLAMLDPLVPFDVAAAQTWFSQRVIGQQEAVEWVVDLLATVKAALARPKKPIASLLFIGPTGVGKTEMAKALAEFMFHDPAKLTRFDMSEFSDPVSVQRLIGTSWNAEGLLTAKVREKPFSVVLFDEVEKADSSFFDLLLQVLGEGRLTDSSGRVADFCNTVVLMTSNLGAESFQHGRIGIGTDNLAREAHEHFTNAVRRFVRPELFNRIDRVVPFMPLGLDVVRQITERELNLIVHRDGVKYRGVAWHQAPEIVPYLAQKGFDPRYGARQLKRTIERELLVPTATRLNQYSVDNALSATITLQDGNLSVDVKPQRDAHGRQIPSNLMHESSREMASACVQLRKRVMQLDACAIMRNVRNDLFWLQRRELKLRQRLQARKKVALQAAYDAELTALPALRDLVHEVDTLRQRAIELEDDALLWLFGQSVLDPATISPRHEVIAAQIKALVLKLYLRTLPKTDAIIFALYSDTAEMLYKVGGWYYQLAQRWNYTVRFRSVIPNPEGRGKGSAVVFRDEPNPVRLFVVPDPRTIGFVMAFSGPQVQMRLLNEAGLHLFIADRESKVLIDTSTQSLDTYTPPLRIERKGNLPLRTTRRRYVDQERMVYDSRLHNPYGWKAGMSYMQILETLIELNVERSAELAVFGADF